MIRYYILQYIPLTNRCNVKHGYNVHSHKSIKYANTEDAYKAK